MVCSAPWQVRRQHCDDVLVPTEAPPLLLLIHESTTKPWSSIWRCSHSGRFRFTILGWSLPQLSQSGPRSLSKGEGATPSRSATAIVDAAPKAHWTDRQTEAHVLHLTALQYQMRERGRFALVRRPLVKVA